MVKIGSARMDENGKISGGKAGDQTGKEVSTQDWYLHSKGWYVLRAKDAAAREVIARSMQAACDNPMIGYDQGQNMSLFNAAKPYDFDVSKVRVPCETDCAKLVRVCVLSARISCDDFYTANEAATLKKTGQFTQYTTDKYCKSSDYLMRGDILVTRSKGHTAVVLSNGSKVSGTTTNAGTAANTAVKTQDALYRDASYKGVYRAITDVNLRTGAGTSHKIIAVVKAGKQVENYGFYNFDASGNAWLYVKAGDQTGYIRASFLIRL